MIEILPNWHPIFVHFTVALFSLSALLYLVTTLMEESELAQQWRVVARWSLYFGMGMTILTVASGIYAYNTVSHDAPSHAAMTVHRNWALVTVGLFAMITIWSVVAHKGERQSSLIFVIAILIGAGILGSTAWRGGEIVYRYGLGVISLPQTDDHGHASGAAPHDDGGDAHGHEDSSKSHDDSDRTISMKEKPQDDSDGGHEEQAKLMMQGGIDTKVDMSVTEHDNSDGHHEVQTQPMMQKMEMKKEDDHNADGHSH